MKALESTEWNFLVGSEWQTSDKELFFGPGESFIELPSDITFPEILSLAGVFPSRTAARKNGWGEQRIATFKWFPRKMTPVVCQPGSLVPEGFTDFRAGKGKHIRITILNIT